MKNKFCSDVRYQTVVSEIAESLWVEKKLTHKAFDVCISGTNNNSEEEGLLKSDTGCDSKPCWNCITLVGNRACSRARLLQSAGRWLSWVRAGGCHECRDYTSALHWKPEIRRTKTNKTLLKSFIILSLTIQGLILAWIIYKDSARTAQ